MQSLVFCLSLLLPTVARAQVFGTGPCKRPDVQKNFDVKKYLGRWYEVERYFPIFFEQNLVCGTATYGLMPNGSVSVINRAVNRLSRERDEVNGMAAPVANAKFEVGFGAQTTQFALPGNNVNGNYWVLGTDYTSYSIVFSCQQLFGIGLFHLDIVWILGRTPTLPAATISNIYALLKAEGIRTRFLRKDMQINEVPCKDYY